LKHSSRILQNASQSFPERELLSGTFVNKLPFVFYKQSKNMNISQYFTTKGEGFGEGFEVLKSLFII
jgi:hypothetical protein